MSARRPAARVIPWPDMTPTQRKDHLRLAHHADTGPYGIGWWNDMWHGLNHVAGPPIPHTHDKETR